MTKSLTSKHLVSAEVECTRKDGSTGVLQLKNIPLVWRWNVTSREAAELGAVLSYLYTEFDFESFSVINFTSSSAVKDFGAATPVVYW
jgi:hypothetical protein